MLGATKDKLRGSAARADCVGSVRIAAIPVATRGTASCREAPVRRSSSRSHRRAARRFPRKGNRMANNAPTAPALRNPRTEYPRPPFPPQQQDPAGLALKMTLRPDHGETSYNGTARMVGRRALIAGGDSGVGRAAAIAFAREGVDVAFGYLPVEEPDAREVVELIQAEGRKAVALPGDIRYEAYCEQSPTPSRARGPRRAGEQCGHTARGPIGASISERPPAMPGRQ
jgi:hypothetical protein